MHLGFFGVFVAALERLHRLVDANVHSREFVKARDDETARLHVSLLVLGAKFFKQNLQCLNDEIAIVILPISALFDFSQGILQDVLALLRVKHAATLVHPHVHPAKFFVQAPCVVVCAADVEAFVRTFRPIGRTLNRPRLRLTQHQTRRVRRRDVRRRPNREQRPSDDQRRGLHPRRRRARAHRRRPFHNQRIALILHRRFKSRIDNDTHIRHDCQSTKTSVVLVLVWCSNRSTRAFVRSRVRRRRALVIAPRRWVRWVFVRVFVESVHHDRACVASRRVSE